MKAIEELIGLKIERCPECKCPVGDDWDYKDYSGRCIVICPQCSHEISLFPPPEIKNLKFICPKCNKDILECCEDTAFVSSSIKFIDESGDFEYGEVTVHDGIVCRFQCLYCGYILKDKDEKNIDENLEVVEWLKKNCKQEK